LVAAAPDADLDPVDRRYAVREAVTFDAGMIDLDHPFDQSAERMSSPMMVSLKSSSEPRFFSMIPSRFACWMNATTLGPHRRRMSKDARRILTIMRGRLNNCRSWKLQIMEELDADWLPVFSASGAFTGIVEHSRVTASLILDAPRN
jgi:hypothetical protein